MLGKMRDSSKWTTAMSLVAALAASLFQPDKIGKMQDLLYHKEAKQPDLQHQAQHQASHRQSVHGHHGER